MNCAIYIYIYIYMNGIISKHMLDGELEQNYIYIALIFVVWCWFNVRWKECRFSFKTHYLWTFWNNFGLLQVTWKLGSRLNPHGAGFNRFSNFNTPHLKLNVFWVNLILDKIYEFWIFLNEYLWKKYHIYWNFQGNIFSQQLGNVCCLNVA